MMNKKSHSRLRYVCVLSMNIVFVSLYYKVKIIKIDINLTYRIHIHTYTYIHTTPIEMNSYGSVSRVSETIYKILRYMNIFPNRYPENLENLREYEHDQEPETEPLSPLSLETSCEDVHINMQIADDGYHAINDQHELQSQIEQKNETASREIKQDRDISILISSSADDEMK